METLLPRLAHDRDRVGPCREDDVRKGHVAARLMGPSRSMLRGKFVDSLPLMKLSGSGVSLEPYWMHGFLLAPLLLSALLACSLARGAGDDEQKDFRETLALVQEVKAFGRTLGIEPTDALRQSSREKPARSMLWLWLQRLGTIALRTSLDVRLEIQFLAAKEDLPLEQLYLSGGYSIYFRQGNQFGDPRSIATIDFARDSVLMRVKTALHEDLHDDRNFDLPWEDEESIITPLGALAALEFFKHKADHANVKRSLQGIEEERTRSKELVAIAQAADQLFRMEPLSESRKKVIALVRSSPNYASWFDFHLERQDADRALEAKISHDLAYYKYYERIVSLYENRGELRTLIRDLKKIPQGMTGEALEKFLAELQRQ